MSCGDGGGGGDDGGADAGDAGDPCTSDGEWYDEHTGLCWQDPPGDSLMIQDEAIAHCDDLVLGGRDDWRLPRIQELIALVRGCGDGPEIDGLSTSACAASDPGCLDTSCSTGGGVCDDLDGPDGDPAGCYWIPDLGGTCDIFLSQSSVTDVPSGIWAVSYQNGGVAIGHEDDVAYARCLRDGL